MIHLNKEECILQPCDHLNAGSLFEKINDGSCSSNFRIRIDENKNGTSNFTLRAIDFDGNFKYPVIYFDCFNIKNNDSKYNVVFSHSSILQKISLSTLKSTSPNLFNANYFCYIHCEPASLTATLDKQKMKKLLENLQNFITDCILLVMPNYKISRKFDGMEYIESEIKVQNLNMELAGFVPTKNNTFYYRTISQSMDSLFIIEK